MQPVLNNWLLERVEGGESSKNKSHQGSSCTVLTSQCYADDTEVETLREAYLPEVTIGYISVLHFAGTSLSRDNLLECMELSSLIAHKDSDVQSVVLRSGRMKEMVEGFANCSKALAISSNEKKGSGTASKKMRDLGWTRELWSVKGV